MDITNLKLNFPLAMNPPKGDVVIINSDLMAEAIKMSLQSPRGRIILPFHKTTEDHLQRMLNVLQPKSYIQPHRHQYPPKTESVIVIRGSIGFVIFNESGKVSDLYTLTAGSTEFGIDTCAGVYHTFFALEKNAVLFEVKPGPYTPSNDKDFAPWAPSEGSETAEKYLMDLYRLFKK